MCVVSSPKWAHPTVSWKKNQERAQEGHQNQQQGTPFGRFESFSWNFAVCYQPYSRSSCSFVVALVREVKAIGKYGVWKLVGLFPASSLYSLYWQGRAQSVRELITWNSSCLIWLKSSSYWWYSSIVVHSLIFASLWLSHASLQHINKGCFQNAKPHILKVDKLAESVFLPPKIGGKSA